MRISRLVLSGAAIGTIAGTGRADLNRSHVFNPDWPPHARFHSVAGWGSVAGSQLLALWLLWRPGQHADEDDVVIKIAALLPAIAWPRSSSLSLRPVPRLRTSRDISPVSPVCPRTLCRPR